MQLPDSALSKFVQIHVGHKAIEPLGRHHAASAWLLIMAVPPSHSCIAILLSTLPFDISLRQNVNSPYSSLKLVLQQKHQHSVISVFSTEEAD
jgi:hypothetical protein